MYRFSAAVGLLLAAVLGACAEAPTAAPDMQAVTPALANASGPVIQAARGSAHLMVGGERRTFTFNAEKRADGTVTGTFEVIARQVDRISHGTITCMTVFGRSAWLGGVIERDNSGVTTGAAALFRVVDLGAGGPPDLVSLLQPSFAPNAARNYCNFAPFFPPLNPIVGGQIVVTTPGSMSYTSTATFPVNLPVYVPCANGGTGEMVTLGGSLHTLFHVTSDASGGFHFMSETNPQGISGVGAITGDKYQGTGVTRSDFNVSGLPFNRTYVNNFRIIGPGTGNNLLVHQTFHVTANANGEITSTVDHWSAECR